MHATTLWAGLRKALLVPIVAAIGCGGDWAPAYEPSASLPDDPKTQPVQEYPKVKFGTTIGAVIKNITFDKAFFDPAMFCTTKSTNFNIKNTEGVKKLSFLDFYRTNAACPGAKKQLLWMVVTAGW